MLGGLTVAAVLLAGSALAGPAWAGPGAAPSTTSPGGDTGDAIASAQAEAQSLEASIVTEQQQLSSLSERYDQDTVALAQVQTRLATADADVARSRAEAAALHHQLQAVAVNAYMSDSSLQGVAGLFDPSGDSAMATPVYRTAAVGNVDEAEAAVRANQRRLSNEEHVLRQEQAQAASQQAAVAAAQQQAQQVAAASQATLAQVKGQLAQLVAQQAAQQAAAAAAQAAAAANAAAKQQAAEQAGAAAQVVETVAPGTTLSTQATDDANQAAGATGTVGSGLPEAAAGAGAVALSAAEQYLGVPYVWGGASAAGVDCSGLVMLAWEAAGVDLPHSAALQYAESTHIPLAQVEPGDLLFYDLDGTGIDHVVMYVGSGAYGADTIIQAAHTGTVVEFDPIWYAGLVGAARP